MPRKGPRGCSLNSGEKVAWWSIVEVAFSKDVSKQKKLELNLKNNAYNESFGETKNLN